MTELEKKRKVRFKIKIPGDRQEKRFFNLSHKASCHAHPADPEVRPRALHSELASQVLSLSPRKGTKGTIEKATMRD